MTAEFSGWQVDGILIGSATNRRWLSGFTGSAGWLLVTAETAVLGTDFRYWDQAKRQAPDFELRNFRSGFSEAWETLFDFDKSVRLGIEARHVALAQFKEFSDVGNVSFVELDGTVEMFRQVKTVDELDAIRRAAGLPAHTSLRAPYRPLKGMRVARASSARKIPRRQCIGIYGSPH